MPKKALLIAPRVLLLISSTTTPWWQWGAGGGHPPGTTGGAQTVLFPLVMPVLWFLAQASNLPVIFNFKKPDITSSKTQFVPVCSGEVLGNVWWAQGR